MPSLSTRTEIFTDSVIRRMTRISAQYGAINLSQGFPDFDPPKELTDSLARAALEGPHQYAITWGAQNFREALAAKHKHFSGLDVDPNKEIVVTCGSTEAMMAAVMAVVNPGEKVIGVHTVSGTRKCVFSYLIKNEQQSAKTPLDTHNTIKRKRINIYICILLNLCLHSAIRIIAISEKPVIAVKIVTIEYILKILLIAYKCLQIFYSKYVFADTAKPNCLHKM